MLITLVSAQTLKVFFSSNISSKYLTTLTLILFLTMETVFILPED